MLVEFIKDGWQKIVNRLKDIDEDRIIKNRQLFYEKVLIQSERDFLDACGERDSTKQQKVALAIRNAIARIGRVEVDRIGSDLSFSDLDLLPIWDCDIFQTNQLIDAIESELGVRFTERQLELATVRNPDLHPDMKIHEFIDEFYDWFRSRS